jgi:hypothetical protein
VQLLETNWENADRLNKARPQAPAPIGEHVLDR